MLPRIFSGSIKSTSASDTMIWHFTDCDCKVTKKIAWFTNIYISCDSTELIYPANADEMTPGCIQFYVGAIRDVNNHNTCHILTVMTWRRKQSDHCPSFLVLMCAACDQSQLQSNFSNWVFKKKYRQYYGKQLLMRRHITCNQLVLKITPYIRYLNI